MVDLKGFEPSTSRMRTERSPSWATSPNMKLLWLRYDHFGLPAELQARTLLLYTVFWKKQEKKH